MSVLFVVGFLLLLLLFLCFLFSCFFAFRIISFINKLNIIFLLALFPFHQALEYIGGFSRSELPHVVEQETVKEDGTVVRRCVSAGRHLFECNLPV